MDLGKLSYYSRKIHRISLWFVTGLGIVQMCTGVTLKYPKLFPFVDFAWVHEFHIATSGYFAAAFLVSMITGLVMYFTPFLIKRSNKPSDHPTKLPN
jgi:hypothetical protein